MSLKLGLVAAALVAATSFSAYAADAVTTQAQAAAPVNAQAYGNPYCANYGQGCQNYQDCPRYHDGNGGYYHRGSHRGMNGDGPAYNRGVRGDGTAYHHGYATQGQPRMGRGPANVNADELNAHTSRMLRDWCPKHNQPLAACLGPELQESFKEDYKRLYDLQDQVFVKDKVLQAQVNAGEDAATITKYATDVNKARREYSNFVAQLKGKVHKFAAAHKAGATANTVAQ